MGIDRHGTRFLLYARTLDVDFSRTAMLGRQRLMLGNQDLKDTFTSFGHAAGDALVESILTRNKGFAEPLLESLGANVVHSFDNSAYEGATHLHDMNAPVTDGLRRNYDVVLDGGSLEHIFNFPTAIRNCMEMLKVGGHYLGISPANNFMGHGFYQFSPELYFSVFTPENGFELLSMIAYEDRPDSPWYSVRSPTDVRGRVTLTNKVPAYLLIVAKRVALADIFATTPQQSDYVVAWHRDGVPAAGNAPKASRPAPRVSPIDRVKRRIPAPLKNLLKEVLGLQKPEFDPRFFQPLDPVPGRSSSKPLRSR